MLFRSLGHLAAKLDPLGMTERIPRSQPGIGLSSSYQKQI